MNLEAAPGRADKQTRGVIKTQESIHDKPLIRIHLANKKPFTKRRPSLKNNLF